MNPIQSALAAITFAPAIIFENLTMVPLVARESGVGPHPDYILLDDALASGTAEITEVSKNGSVPELRFVNRGTLPVLIIDGQELVGAKQNRVVNLTILAPPQATVIIPVSCVESGRWSARSRAFSAAPRTQYASGRAKRVAQVTQSIVDRGVRMSDQSAIWEDIAATSARLSASSSTGAMEAIFDRHAAFIDRCADAFRPLESQVGVMFAVNDSIVALDIFDHAATLVRVLPKLGRAAAVDALDRSSEPRADAKLSTRGCDVFLAHVSAGAQHSAPAVGLGEDVRLSSPSIAGAALVVNDAVVHLSAFASA